MIESLCENCGEAFEATSRRAKYCSTSCKQQAYRSRQENEAFQKEYPDRQDAPDWDDQEEEWEDDHPSDQSEWEEEYENVHGDDPDDLEAEPDYRNSEEKGFPRYRNKNESYRNKETDCYDKNDVRYGNIGSERYDSSHPRYGNTDPERYDRNLDEPHHNPSHDRDPNERRRYPLHFYAPNGMFTAQAIEQLPRLDQLALKHKPARYSDETWFEFLESIDGIPVDIYTEARKELEQEQQQASIAEMNTRIVRWFPRLLEFAHADEVELKIVEALLTRMRSFIYSDRFRRIPADHPHRLELLKELDIFTGLVEAHRDQGYESMVLYPSDNFLERMDRVISAAQRE